MIICPDLPSMRAWFDAHGCLHDLTLPRDDLVVFLETGLRIRAGATLHGDADTVMMSMPPVEESGVTDTVVLRMPYEGNELWVSVPIPMFVGLVVDALYRGDTLVEANVDAMVKATIELFVRDHAVRH